MRNIKKILKKRQKKTVTYQYKNKRPNSLISSNDVAIFKSKPNKDMIITEGKKQKKKQMIINHQKQKVNLYQKI